MSVIGQYAPHVFPVRRPASFLDPSKQVYFKRKYKKSLHETEFLRFGVKDAKAVPNQGNVATGWLTYTTV